MPTFKFIHLHQYVRGLLTQVQILRYYPWETATTLANAVALRKGIYPAEV